MSGLLRDRYFEYAPDRAWDLVTGATVSSLVAQEEERSSGPAAAPLIELLDHGVEGVPRWVISEARAANWPAQVRLIASEARRRGYVPIGVSVFLRVRLLLAEELRTRAIVLIAAPNASPEHLRRALLHASAISPRPHVLMSVAHHVSGRGVERWQAAEARAVYGAERPATVGPTGMSMEVRRLIERAERAPELVRCGRHAAAERLLREVAAALARRNARQSAARVCISLGQMLLERGRPAAAETAFDEAATHAERGFADLLVSARIWQAAARTDAAHLTAAESLCRAVLLTSRSDSEERARAEATLGRVLLWQGRAADACALPFVRESTGSVFACATRVRLLIETGDVFAAGQRARDLLDRTADGDPTSQAIALGAHIRVLLATGDLRLAEQGLNVFASAARTARLPLRLVRLRLQWSRALRRAGRTNEAERELRSLARMRSALPPLLRSTIDRESRVPTASAVSRHPVRSKHSEDATELVVLAQREHDDREALQQIGNFVLRELTATRVELWTADAGPATAVVTSGAGLATQLGCRTLDAGTVIGPEAVESGWEVAVPVRLGTQLIGALSARWAADRRTPDEATTLLSLAAAVAAPRVDALIHAARQVAQAATAIPELVGMSVAMAEVRRAVVRAAAAPFSVLIEGESGVGKELVARAIHHLSARRDRRFCDVNCAALPDELFESELFGHARGAFTGAVRDRAGLVEEADGGTLFLDEVADLSARAQAKLLRVVQQQEVRRVGESFTRKVDVRFVSAANRDMRAEEQEGRFRQDLRYRLEVIRIRIPPLRERPEDIPSLASHFWTVAAGRMNTRATLSHGILTALSRYQWPGNVRELQNVMAALAVEAPTRGVVRAALLPAALIGSAAGTPARFSEARLQWERRFVELALGRAGGSRTRAARDLGLSRQGLIKLLARVGLHQSTDTVK